MNLRYRESHLTETQIAAFEQGVKGDGSVTKVSDMLEICRLAKLGLQYGALYAELYLALEVTGGEIVIPRSTILEFDAERASIRHILDEAEGTITLESYEEEPHH